MKKSQADEDCIFLMSLLSSIKKLDDIQRVELSIEFLSSVDRRIHIFKNLSPTVSNTSCLQLHLRVQQVSILQIVGIQTLQSIHRGYPVSEAQIYSRVSFRFNSESL